MTNEKSVKHLRINFYEAGDKGFFGEYTLTPATGILYYFTNNRKIK